MTGRRLRALAVAALALGVAPVGARAAAASDLWTTLQVKLDLVREARTDALDIEVDTAEGLVTLHGVATDDEEKAKAESIARGVGGMRPVRNLIQVIPDAERAAVSRSDDEIRRDVEATLRRGRRPRPRARGVGESGRSRALRRVASLAAHLRAIDLVSGVSGVRHVASELRSPDRAADAEIWRDTLTLAEPPAGAAARRVDHDGRGAEPARERGLRRGARRPHPGGRGDAVRHRRVGATAGERRGAVKQVAFVRAVRNELQVVPPSERAGDRAARRRDPPAGGAAPRDGRRPRARGDRRGRAQRRRLARG